MAQEARDIGRGHAEVLMEIIENCLATSNTTYEDLSRLGVTIGPGSFTGVRVGMSVARGFGLSLGIPVVGISTLDACEATAREIDDQANLVSLLDAKRGELYCKVCEQPPFAASYKDIDCIISQMDVTLCGSGAAIFNQACDRDLPIIHQEASFDIGLIARLAEKAKTSSISPEPLYLRSADAKVQAGFALERLETNA